MAPSFVSGSSGSPGTICRPTAAIFSSIASLIDACDQQPRAGRAHLALVEEDRERGRGRRASRSGQSASTMLGDLPPHSSETFLRFDCAASCITALPVAVEPVNAMQSTSMCAASAVPAGWPKPGTTLNTPGGRPASIASSATRSAVSGDFSEGLSTSELPLASTGPIFQDAINSGKFHGTMAPTTPIGSRVMVASARGPGGRDFVVDLVDGLRVPADAVRRRRDVHREAVGDRLAGVERLEQREFVACSRASGPRTAATRACAPSAPRAPNYRRGTPCGRSRPRDRCPAARPRPPRRASGRWRD